MSSKLKKILLLMCGAGYCGLSLAANWVNSGSADSETGAIEFRLNNLSELEIIPKITPNDSSFQMSKRGWNSWGMTQTNCANSCDWFDKLPNKEVLLAKSDPHYNDIQTKYTLANIGHREGKVFVNLDGSNGGRFMLGQYNIPRDGFTLADCQASNKQSPQFICFKNTSDRNSKVVPLLAGYIYPQDGVDGGLIINIKPR